VAEVTIKDACKPFA